MKELLLVFWNIALLRTTPDRLPTSPFLLAVVVVIHMLLGFVVALFSLTLDKALLSTLAGSATLLALVYLLLAIQGRGVRYLQTVTALAGSEVIVGLVMVAATLLMHIESVPLQDFGAMVTLLALGWNMALAAYIFSSAVDTGRVMGFGYALGYLALSILVLEKVVG